MLQRTCYVTFSILKLKMGHIDKSLMCSLMVDERKHIKKAIVTSVCIGKLEQVVFAQ